MKSMHYGRLEGIYFSLSCGEVFELLRKAGEIPDGFSLDCENPENTDWPIELRVKRYVPTHNSKCTCGATENYKAGAGHTESCPAYANAPPHPTWSAANPDTKP